MALNEILVVPSLLLLIINISVGFYWRKHPPKKINWLYGYRTKSSMSNQERWDFAQQKGATNMMKSSLLFLVSLCLGLFVEKSLVGWSIAILLITTLLWVVLVFLYTERQIERQFGKAEN